VGRPTELTTGRASARTGPVVRGDHGADRGRLFLPIGRATPAPAAPRRGLRRPPARPATPSASRPGRDAGGRRALPPLAAAGGGHARARPPPSGRLAAVGRGRGGRGERLPLLRQRRAARGVLVDPAFAEGRAAVQKFDGPVLGLLRMAGTTCPVGVVTGPNVITATATATPGAMTRTGRLFDPHVRLGEDRPADRAVTLEDGRVPPPSVPRDVDPLDVRRVHLAHPSKRRNTADRLSRRGTAT
jgi:hypothetical protein